METTPGRLVIAPEVLTTIVRKTAEANPGVDHLCSTVTGRMNRMFRGNKSVPGIDIDLQDGAVVVDLFVVATREVKMRELGEQLQRDISRALSEIVGMPVRAVNVHIEDVADPFETQEQET